MTIAESKAAVRRQVLAARDGMTVMTRVRASRLICARIAADPGFATAQVMLGYFSFGSEIDTRSLLDAALRAGKILVLPRVDVTAGVLELYRVTDLAADLQAGQWGILEPRPDPAARMEVGAVDFALVPGVAFDSHCNRLGYGKGFYDRLFARALDERMHLPRRVAGAYDCQIVATVPVRETDLPVDRVITENFDYQRKQTS